MNWIFWILVFYASIGMVMFLIFEIFRRDIHESIRRRNRNKVLLHVILYFARPLVFFTLWPVYPIYKCAEIIFIRKKLEARRAYKELVESINKPKPEIKEKVLMHQYMGGAGDIVCEECFYQEHIVSFLHGFGPDAWTNTGYQCQSCGKFQSIERAYKLDQIPTCECGGKLSRDEVLFCPKCRSTKLDYLMKYIT